MKTSKKLLLYFASLAACILLGTSIIIACADEGDPYDYYTFFFHNDVQGKKDYSPFYFTDYHFTYSDEEPASEAAINAKEWVGYLGAGVKAGEVEKIMYHLDSAGKDGLYNYLEQDAPAPDSVSGNAFIQSLKEPEREDARKYYQFALRAERLGQVSDNYWEPAPLDTSGLIEASEEALHLGEEQKDNYLKLRYYYQAQKLNHYAAKYKEAQNVYDDFITPIKSDSHVKGWALALKAGEARRLGDTTNAAFLFSKVFANYPERRLQAYRNYHYIDAPFDDVLKLASTPKEKANLYAIRGFGNMDLETEDLEKVYEYAPSSQMVGTLLVREINKLEQGYLNLALDNNSDEFYRKQLNTEVTAIGPLEPTGQWLLWPSVLVLVAGLGMVVFIFKKQPEKRNLKIAGFVITAIGVAGLIGYGMSQFSGKPGSVGKLEKAGFFVALPDSVKNTYDNHIEKLRGFCTKLAEDANYPEPQIGTIANAYLSFMQNQPAQGLKDLEKLNTKTLPEKLNDQKQIVQLLLSAQNMKQVKAVDEAALLPGLKWLRGKSIAEGKTKRDVYPATADNVKYFAITERNFYTYVLAPAYLRQGDTSKAALALLCSQNDYESEYRLSIFKQAPDFWYTQLHAAALNQIIGLKTQRPADAYLAFLSDGLKKINSSTLYELLGTVLLREHRYQDAEQAFITYKAKSAKGPANDLYISSGNPFVADINDYPNSNGKGISKLQFAEKMAVLERKLKTNPKDAEAYFQMANGLYNTSTYSNSWNFISYNWSTLDFGRSLLYDYDKDYIEAATAEQYYLKARDFSDDDDFKAKCTFMAAKCKQKQNVAPTYEDYNDYTEREKAYLKMLKENSYFKELKSYKHTAFYRKAVAECSYLSDFIAGK
ncbi:hypothetical protein LPB86_16820 [Pedobacter sp. MC2016-14]|uniref:hypothetical protein n=1 Tax=Pedobacter sp. MC2016-14 TaxID=2897327 RepID=UPI001E5EE68D|nr:hypothetical protein [Pedobacter sp. MC2016-14]MCD0489907.1 hypothetical protein [Pedobacter sp. MC2016-14]